MESSSRGLWRAVSGPGQERGQKGDGALRLGLPWGLGLYPGPEEDAGGFQASRPPGAAGDVPHCASGAALGGPMQLGHHETDGTTVGFHRTLLPSGSTSEPRVGGRPDQAVGVSLE